LAVPVLLPLDALDELVELVELEEPPDVLEPLPPAEVIVPPLVLVPGVPVVLPVLLPVPIGAFWPPQAARPRAMSQAQVSTGTVKPRVTSEDCATPRDLSGGPGRISRRPLVESGDSH
jgi:hypothetical protein